MNEVRAGQRWQDSDGDVFVVEAVRKLGASARKQRFGCTPDTPMVWHYLEGDDTRHIMSMHKWLDMQDAGKLTKI